MSSKRGKPMQSSRGHGSASSGDRQPTPISQVDDEDDSNNATERIRNRTHKYHNYRLLCKYDGLRCYERAQQGVRDQQTRPNWRLVKMEQKVERPSRDGGFMDNIHGGDEESARTNAKHTAWLSSQAKLASLLLLVTGDSALSLIELNPGRNATQQSKTLKDVEEAV